MSFFQNFRTWLKKNILSPEKKQREIHEIKEKIPGELFQKKVKKTKGRVRLLKKERAPFLPRPSKPFVHTFRFKRKEIPLVLGEWLRPQNLSLKSCIKEVIMGSTRYFFTHAFGFADKIPKSDPIKEVEKALLEMNLFCYKDSGAGELTEDFIHYREDLSYKVFQYFDDMGYIGDLPIEEKKKLLEFCRKEVKRAYADILMSIDFQLVISQKN